MAAFVEEHADALYRFLHHRIDRPEAAEDLVQEVFLAAWASAERFRGDSEPRTWLLAIARHKVADYYRSRLTGRPLPEASDDEPLPDLLITLPDPDARLDAERVAARARRVLAALPDLYREVLVWRYWAERPLAEMAAQTGLTEKAIERLLDRARRMFKRRWQDE
jgi:RNA polymerase sigma-70 factor (ECF subfamily)